MVMKMDKDMQKDMDRDRERAGYKDKDRDKDMDMNMGKDMDIYRYTDRRGSGREHGDGHIWRFFLCPSDIVLLQYWGLSDTEYAEISIS
jgi:hypothetical protein